jgi:asparagine synthase (glutamine-hydrolysing)
MPGLVGIFETAAARPIERTHLEAMTTAIVHRPWYRTESHVDAESGVAIARVHLGVLNPEPQPYISEGGQLQVFLDGEIYNEEAAGRQLAWIAEAYRRHGAGVAARLNGSFALVVLDRAARRVVIATDRTASRPLFCWQDGSTLYVAPELKALLTLPGLTRRLDWRAVAGFLASGFWLNGYTAVEGVRRLEGATVLTIERAGLRRERYWQYRFTEGEPDRGEQHYRDTLAELVRAAVRRQLRGDHRYGVLLSGGYDSRGLLGCYLAERPGVTPTTISWGVDESTPDSDCWIARRVAARVGSRHRFYPLRPEALVDALEQTVSLSDGMTAAAGNYPEGLSIFAAIREELGVQVLLRGDECLGWRDGPFDEPTVLRSVGIHGLDDVAAYHTLLEPAAHRRLSELVTDLRDEISARCPAAAPHDRKDFFYLDQRLQYYLHPLNYFKTLEVEARRPYLDNDILDFVTTLPVKYRLDKALFRRTVVHMFPGLFEQMARHSNLIDWRHRLDTDEALRRFVRQRLAAPGGLLDGVLATGGLLAGAPAGRPARRPDQVAVAARSIKRHPWVYQRLRPAYQWLRRRRQRSAAVTPDVVFRLLTLTLWGGQFLGQEAPSCVASPES